MELREVQRHVHPQIRLDPACQAAKLLVAVVERGQDQVDDLRPFAHLAQRHKCLQHRLQLAFDHVAVVGLGEGLQVDLDGVHLPVGSLQSLLPNEAVRDYKAPNAGLVARVGRVHQEFAEDHWLAVGEGNRRAVVLLGKFNDAPRRKVLSGNLFGTRLRNLPVLAEFAIEVAAGRGQRKGIGPRQIVKKRLLLDRIDVRRADPRVDQRIKDAAAILAHPAVAALILCHGALARAQFAPDLLILKFFVEPRFDGEARITPCFGGCIGGSAAGLIASVATMHGAHLRPPPAPQSTPRPGTWKEKAPAAACVLAQQGPPAPPAVKSLPGAAGLSLQPLGPCRQRRGTRIPRGAACSCRSFTPSFLFSA